jgi:ABC-type antimicrobial peptide transport system permease subunit
MSALPHQRTAVRGERQILDEAGFIFPMLIRWKPAVVVFSLAIVLAALVGLWPAYHATRLCIAEAIASE